MLVSLPAVTMYGRSSRHIQDDYDFDFNYEDEEGAGVLERRALDTLTVCAVVGVCALAALAVLAVLAAWCLRRRRRAARQLLPPTPATDRGPAAPAPAPSAPPPTGTLPRHYPHPPANGRAVAMHPLEAPRPRRDPGPDGPPTYEQATTDTKY